MNNASLKRDKWELQGSGSRKKTPEPVKRQPKDTFRGKERCKAEITSIVSGIMRPT